MTFELQSPLPGSWKTGQSHEFMWMQYLDPDGNPELTVQRKLACLSAEFIVHKIPETMPGDHIVPFSLQDYSGEEFIACDGHGFLLDNGVGGLAFRTGLNDFDNDYETHLNVIRRITDAFCLIVIEEEYIFPIDARHRELLEQLFVPNPSWTS
jgi:hypothetical protein